VSCRTGLRGVSDDRSRSGRRFTHLVGGQHDHLVRPVDRLARDRQRARRRVDRPLLYVVFSAAAHRRRRRRILRHAAPPDNVVKPGRVLFSRRNRLRHSSTTISLIGCHTFRIYSFHSPTAGLMGIGNVFADTGDRSKLTSTIKPEPIHDKFIISSQTVFMDCYRGLYGIASTHTRPFNGHFPGLPGLVGCPLHHHHHHLFAHE